MRIDNTKSNQAVKTIDFSVYDLPLPNPFCTLLSSLTQFLSVCQKAKRVDKPFLNILFISMLLISPFRGTLTGQTLILHEKVSVKGEDLQLGQLLQQARGIDPKILKMRIGETPPIGNKRKWTRGMVDKFLKKHYHGTIAWDGDGPKACIVDRPGRWVEEKTVLLMIEKSLRRLTKGEGKASVEELNQFQSFAIPAGPSDIVVDLPSSTLSNPWAVATIHFEEDGDRVITKNIRFRWSWVRPAWRSNDSAKSGAYLNASKFEAIMVDVLKESRDLYLDGQFPIDMQLTRSISPGSLLTRSQFRPRVLIRQGDPVVVHYRDGGVKISISAVAMRDGARNEIIPARNNKSRKLLSVRVIDERNVAYAN
ncbi:MAG: flagellar basal body P-ring formation chaperone FlgA [Verrucomicrobiota bacterium]